MLGCTAAAAQPSFSPCGMDALASSDAQQEDQADMMESAGGAVVDRGIDKARSRYPYCIVWSPLPCITWFIPLIGEVWCSTRAVVFHRAVARMPTTRQSDHHPCKRATLTSRFTGRSLYSKLLHPGVYLSAENHAATCSVRQVMLQQQTTAAALLLLCEWSTDGL